MAFTNDEVSRRPGSSSSPTRPASRPTRSRWRESFTDDLDIDSISDDDDRRSTPRRSSASPSPTTRSETSRPSGTPSRSSRRTSPDPPGGGSGPHRSRPFRPHQGSHHEHIPHRRHRYRCHLAIGGTAPERWDALLSGASGARTLEHEWVEQYNLPVTFAAEALVRPETVLERPVAKRLDRRRSSRWSRRRRRGKTRAAPTSTRRGLGVDFATGIGGVWTLLDAWDTLREKGPRRVMPMTVPIAHARSGRGQPVVALQTPARSPAPWRPRARSSTESIVNAVQHIRDGLADV